MSDQGLYKIHKKNNGILPPDISEPSFLADSNQQVKTKDTSVYYALVTPPKRDSHVTKLVITRIKPYGGQC